MPQEDVKQNAKAAASVLEQVGEALGDSGTRRYSGYYSEEFNPIFRNEKRIETLEEMRRSDGAVKGVLNAIKAPIISTTWRVDGEDEKIVEFVEQQLFHMKRSWTEFIRESLSYLDFGHYVFEIVYKKSGNYIGLKDLEPRIPRSIRNWKLKDGSFGIVQNITTDDVKMSVAEIPADKLLILTNDKEGDDVTGQSILRPAFKHYSIKNVLYSIQGIAAERYGVGIPVVKLPATFGDEEKALANEMGQNVRSNEKGYITLPGPDWEFDIKTPAGNPQGQAITEAIQHHNTMILMSVLATFLGLGTDGVGSLALSQDQSGFFLKHVEDKANYLAEQITEQVIKRLVYINFGENAEVPHLRFASLGDIDFKEMSEVLNTLQTGKLIKVDGKFKGFVHKMFKLPELTEDEMAMIDDEEIKGEVDQIEKDVKIQFPNLPDQKEKDIEEDADEGIEEEDPEEETK